MASWDLFEIFNAREDNYTNMLHFMFEEYPPFREKFLQLIFGENISDAKFTTRSVYYRENGGKNIPDIILSNHNHFAIIEVKVFSGEGANQTERYYAGREEMIKNLGIDADADCRFRYLTINGDKPACSSFLPLKWEDVANCMEPKNCPNDMECDMAQLLMKQFRERIESTKPASINLDDKWVDAVHAQLWSGPNRFYAGLQQLDIFKSGWKSDSWTGFEKASNSYNHSAAYYPADGSWQGKELREAAEGHEVEKCFDYHFEFKWEEAQSHLTVRLDYHLNPYYSKNAIESIEQENLMEFAEECNKYRAGKARRLKRQWKQLALKIAPELSDCYSHHISNYLLFLAQKEWNSETIKGLSVREVLALIAPFIELGTEFVNTYCLKES